MADPEESIPIPIEEALRLEREGPYRKRRKASDPKATLLTTDGLASVYCDVLLNPEEDTPNKLRAADQLSDLYGLKRNLEADKLRGMSNEELFALIHSTVLPALRARKVRVKCRCADQSVNPPPEVEAPEPKPKPVPIVAPTGRRRGRPPKRR